MKKLLIGVVTHGKHRYCLDEFLECLSRQSIKTDVLFVVNNGESAYATLLRSKNLNAVEDPKPANTRIEKILNGRKYVREYALKNNYDFLLFVDSDVMLPPDAIALLTMVKADVVSGAYLSAFNLGGKTVIAPVIYKDLGNGECQLYTYEGVAPNKVIDVGAAGLGCTLISKKALQAIDFRTFNNSQTGGEDMAFYVDARAKGFMTVANTKVKCIHRPFPKEDERAKLFEWNKRVEEYEYSLDLSK